MPIARFSIMSIRPIPYAPACSFSRAISSCSGSASPSSETGSPASKPITTSTGSGALFGSDVSRYGSSGGASHGSSRIPASIERPNRFSSNENGRGLRVGDRDAARLRVLDLLVARPDLVAQRGDHAHARVVRAERELEAELVVALAGAAVHGGLGAELQRQLGDGLRDHRPGEGGDERVLALVERVRLQRLRAPGRSRTPRGGRPAATSSAPAAYPRSCDCSRSNSWPTSQSTATTSS